MDPGSPSRPSPPLRRAMALLGEPAFLLEDLAVRGLVLGDEVGQFLARQELAGLRGALDVLLPIPASR